MKNRDRNKSRSQMCNPNLKPGIQEKYLRATSTVIRIMLSNFFIGTYNINTSSLPFVKTYTCINKCG